MSQGLTSQEVAINLKKYGQNDVSEKTSGVIKKFLTPLYSPISLMLLGAAFLSRLNDRAFDAYFILALYFVNYSIQQWQEFKADTAIKELQNKLSFNVSTLRDNQWKPINAKMLVPGDQIRLGLGSIVPADVTVVTSNNLTVNDAVLTGESLPKEKERGEAIYSGTFITSGNLEATVTMTGKNTYFGKTIFSIEPPTQKSILEKDILSITKFLTIISIIAVIILSVVFLWRGAAIKDLLTLDLSLVIAGIPIDLPAVMAIILSIGSVGLGKKMVIVRRLSALQDLSNVNVLLTDKTGTLTKNEISVMRVISYQPDVRTDEISTLASYAVSTETPNAIDLAITKQMMALNGKPDKVDILESIPYDSNRKRSTALIKKDGVQILISLGAPQIITSLSTFASSEAATTFANDITEAAAQGFRVLALAWRKDGVKETQMEIIGLFLLADPLDAHSKETLRFMRDNGIAVRIVTGDNQVITKRIASDLDLPGDILDHRETVNFYNHPSSKRDAREIAAYSEILPKDKYELVRFFKLHHVVASTGDGLNDLPALRAANVGIAVAGAVSALKSMADIVLLSPGLAVIRDAIVESRKIFARLYHYSIYRVSESFRLIITILILGLWYGFYPLLPLQLILLAFLNDIPMVSLAVDRVKIAAKPSEIKTKERFAISLLFGLVGILNSLILFYLMTRVWHFPLSVTQTMFFLKLTVSGHMLIYVAHTDERWFRYLPSKEVLIATITTQIIATGLAVTGFMMPAKIPIMYAVLVWVWTFFWMQISELMKDVQKRLIRHF